MTDTPISSLSADDRRHDGPQVRSADAGGLYPRRPRLQHVSRSLTDHGERRGFASLPAASGRKRRRCADHQPQPDGVAVWDAILTVLNAGLPPQAVQPAPNAAYALDTGDNRFENRSLQVGSRLLNAATVNLFGFSAPSWYNFNIGVSPPSCRGKAISSPRARPTTGTRRSTRTRSGRPPARRSGRSSRPG